MIPLLTRFLPPAPAPPEPPRLPRGGGMIVSDHFIDSTVEYMKFGGASGPEGAAFGLILLQVR